MNAFRLVLTSIRRKIFLVFLGGLVFPVLASAWISYNTSRQIIGEHSLEQQEKTLGELSRSVWSLEDHSRRQIQLLGTETQLTAALNGGRAVPEELLRVFLRLNPRWKSVIIYDRLGRAVWRSDSTHTLASFDPFFLETFNLSENQTPVFELSGHHLTRFGIRISHGENFVGVLSASLDLSDIQRTLNQIRSVGAVRALIWDDSGRIFGTNLTAAEWREVSTQIELKNTAKEILELLGKSFHKQLELSRERTLFSATIVPEFISRLEPVPGENWFIAIITPADTAFGELWGFQLRILAFLASLFLAVALVLSWMTNRLSAPLERMVSFTKQVAQGRRDVALEVPGRDEVAMLSAALNSMAASLQRYEQELIRAEVLSSLGRMSAVVAHEIRNPLNAIKGSVQYLQIRYPSEATVQEYASIVLQKVDRLAHFVESLLKFARLPVPAVRDLNIETLVERAFEPFQQRARDQGVRLKRELNGVSSVRGDEDQIVELFQNVIQNSLDELPKGGELVIQVRRPNQHVEIEFRDTGPGIPPEVLSRLFIPFTTTKKSGTGLGLLLCKMIAENHGGTFEHRPCPKGTCFVLRLPEAN